MRTEKTAQVLTFYYKDSTSEPFQSSRKTPEAFNFYGGKSRWNIGPDISAHSWIHMGIAGHVAQTHSFLFETRLVWDNVVFYPF